MLNEKEKKKQEKLKILKNEKKKIIKKIRIHRVDR